MKAITKFLEQENRMRNIFRQPALGYPRDTKEMKQLVEGALSPVNLMCDGELSAATVRKKLTFLLSVQKELNAAYG